MNAEEVLFDRDLLADFVRRTEALHEQTGRTLAWLRERLNEPEFFEYPAKSMYVQTDDEVEHRGEWRTVLASKACLAAGCWLLSLDGFGLVHTAPGQQFRVRRPRLFGGIVNAPKVTPPRPSACVPACTPPLHRWPCPVAEEIAEGEAWERGE